MKTILLFITIILSIVMRAQLTPEELYENASKNCYVVLNKVGNSLGSGFLLTNGYIITNLHVVDGASPNEITLRPINNTNEIIACEKLYVSSKRDIAVIKPLGTIDNLGLELDTVSPKIGSNVYVIGNSEGYTGTFSDGLVSQIREGDGTDTWIQMSAPISQGNSGGPIMNKNGKVIGISTLTNRFGQNLNFAIPSKYIIDFLRSNEINISINSNQESSPLEQKEITAKKDLNKIRALFTPQQISLIETVNGTYLKRNLMLFFSLFFLLTIIIIVIWVYKTSKFTSFIDFANEYPNSNYRRTIVFILYIIFSVSFYYSIIVFKDNSYPPFFKSRSEFWPDIKKIYDENDLKNYYEMYAPPAILDAAFHGSDLALLCLADGYLRRNKDFDVDTAEAVKWFNALSDKNYYAGHYYMGTAKLLGWDPSDVNTRKFINSVYAFSAGYLNTLAEIHKTTNDQVEKENANKAIRNILSLYCDFITDSSVFYYEDNVYQKIDSIIKKINCWELYVNTYNTINTLGFGKIPSHQLYLKNDILGLKKHNELIMLGKTIDLPWDIAKKYYQKAIHGKELNDNEENKLIFEKIDLTYYIKDTSLIINYNLKYLEKINDTWQKDILSNENEMKNIAVKNTSSTKSTAVTKETPKYKPLFSIDEIKAINAKLLDE